MKKAYILITILALSVTFLASCSSKKGRIIPYDTFKEILIETAFIDSYAKMKLKQEKDSVSIYEPIFNKYGYDINDVKYTIENIASRKSNIIVVLIDEATKEIDKLKNKAEFIYNLNLESIEKGREMGKRVLYEDSKPQMVTKLDSVDMFGFNLPIQKSGEYQIKLRYMVDSLDKNNVRYFHYTLNDSTKNEEIKERTTWLQKKKEFSKIDESIEVKENEKNINQLKVQFLYLGKNEKIFKKPHMRVDSVSVIFHPTDEEACSIFMNHITGLDSIIMKTDSVKNLLNIREAEKIGGMWQNFNLLILENQREASAEEIMRAKYIDNLIGYDIVTNFFIDIAQKLDKKDAKNSAKYFKEFTK